MTEIGKFCHWSVCIARIAVLINNLSVGNGFLIRFFWCWRSPSFRARLRDRSMSSLITKRNIEDSAHNCNWMKASALLVAWLKAFHLKGKTNEKKCICGMHLVQAGGFSSQWITVKPLVPLYSPSEGSRREMESEGMEIKNRPRERGKTARPGQGDYSALRNALCSTLVRNTSAIYILFQIFFFSLILFALFARWKNATVEEFFDTFFEVDIIALSMSLLDWTIFFRVLSFLLYVKKQ